MLRNKWKMALELPGSISPDSFAESFLRICRNGPGASLANSIRFPDQFLIRNGWRMVLELQIQWFSLIEVYLIQKIVLELPCPIPFVSFIRFLWQMYGNCPMEPPRPSTTDSLIQSSSKVMLCAAGVHVRPVSSDVLNKMVSRMHWKYF